MKDARSQYTRDGTKAIKLASSKQVYFPGRERLLLTLFEMIKKDQR